MGSADRPRDSTEPASTTRAPISIRPAPAADSAAAHSNDGRSPIRRTARRNPDYAVPAAHPEAAGARRRGSGLDNLAARMAAVGGSMTVLSRDGWFYVRAECPLSGAVRARPEPGAAEEPAPAAASPRSEHRSGPAALKGYRRQSETDAVQSAGADRETARGPEGRRERTGEAAAAHAALRKLRDRQHALTAARDVLQPAGTADPRCSPPTRAASASRTDRTRTPSRSRTRLPGARRPSCSGPRPLSASEPRAAARRSPRSSPTVRGDPSGTSSRPRCGTGYRLATARSAPGKAGRRRVCVDRRAMPRGALGGVAGGYPGFGRVVLGGG